jgi:hypothetical protein
MRENSEEEKRSLALMIAYGRQWIRTASKTGAVAGGN